MQNGIKVVNITGQVREDVNVGRGYHAKLGRVGPTARLASSLHVHANGRIETILQGAQIDSGIVVTGQGSLIDEFSGEVRKGIYVAHGGLIRQIGSTARLDSTLRVTENGKIGKILQNSIIRLRDQ